MKATSESVRYEDRVDNTLESNIFEVICLIAFCLSVYGIISDLSIGGKQMTLIVDLSSAVIFLTFSCSPGLKKCFPSL